MIGFKFIILDQQNGNSLKTINYSHITDVNLRKTYHDEIITTYLEKLKEHVKQLDNVCKNYFTEIKNSKMLVLEIFLNFYIIMF